ncbi:MAG: hypothetical protein CO094_00600 [Anaerolineae bacterium CG_4_9_14_3_um_filter_57_17]|nr:sensor domain-containing diguanylate cyclase [bacterium]NCT20827.1 sensor domain-containing diguanylate cyclase [bacterium]OIO84173.1 MAG: hypothetical protein AUK01_10445 [Anaerolineae bacterium CG2_30_57_67]PJB68684.1 MAG: hypothetical protein CO094_00600 [Anaerolineae bacterium CG_4_9_14_3_um_filter_57_17]
MKNNNKRTPSNVTEAESNRLARPATLFGLFLFTVLIGYGLWQNALGAKSGLQITWLGLAGILYTIGLYFLLLVRFTLVYRWRLLFTLGNVFATTISLAFLPDDVQIIPHIVITLVAIVTVILWGRSQAQIFIFLTALASVSLLRPDIDDELPEHRLTRFSLFLLAFILAESIHRLIESTHARIQRLEKLNEFGRKIGSSLDKTEVVNLVNAALQEALDADTYYLGILESGQIRLDLLYDDGECFNNTTVSADGTLSGWVVRNHQPLFIPDLRNDVELEGVELIVVGKGRTSLSWMGVPMITAHLTGILAVGSYRHNAFDRTDMELLENLGQQAALALDNAYHHGEVKRQSQMDSLTQVYNHGYFISLLEKSAVELKKSGGSMSLIMMDIDYFKQYNDTYGHLTGDRVLIELTHLLRAYIKSSDSVGRWGGEEFALLLINTTGEQAAQVAQRIQEKVNSLQLQAEDGRQIALPTVSQGIAIFPAETDDIIRLVDMADQRLYLAKERGRNQIEPGVEHWKYIQ